MASIQQIVRRAKQAYWACAHVEQEWLVNELGDDLSIIQNALIDLMYPEQFATPWEKRLYKTLKALMDDLADVGDDRHPETGEPYAACKRAYTVLETFSQEQEQRLEARIQMEAYFRSNKKR